MKDQNQNTNDFQRFFKSVDDLFFILDLNGNIIHFNPEVPRCLGYTDTELSSMSLTDIHSTDHKEEVGAILASIQDGKKAEYHIPLQAKDGHLIPVETKIIDGKWSDEHVFFGISRDITTHKEIEKALRESEERLELVLQGADLGIFDWNLQTGEMIRNIRWAEIFGFTLEEVEPSLDFWEKLIHPDDFPQVKRIMSDFLEEKTTSWEAEYRARTKSGETVWIQDRGKIVEWDEANRPLRVTGTLLDITKRMRAEETLRESEELFRGTFQATAGGVLVVSDSAVIIHANPQFIEMFGVSDEIVRTQDSKNLLESILDQVLEPDEFYSKTLELRKSSSESSDIIFFKDGRVFERFGGPLILEGKIRGRVWSFRDITERKRAEEAVLESEKRYRLLADNVTDVLWVVDMNLRFTYVSPSVQQVFGYTIEESLSMSIDEIMTRESFEAIMTEFAEVVAMEESDRREMAERPAMEVEMFHQDGSRKWTELSRSFLHDEDGTLIGIMGVARDITSRKQAEETQKRERKAFSIIAEAAVHATTVSDLCHRVLDEVIEVLEFDVGAVKLYDKEENLLELIAVVGMSEEDVTRKTSAQRLDDPTTVVPFVTHTKQDIFSVDVTKPDAKEDLNLELDELESRLIISWPIQGTDQELLGVILLMAYTPKLVLEKDRSFFNTVARVFASVLERRRAEEKLAESEERFVLFADHLPGPLYIKDHESRVLFTNRFMRKISGEDWVGKTNFDLFPPEAAEQLTAEEQGVITLGPVETIERRQSENGYVQTFQSLKFPIFRAESPPLIGGFSIDITQQKTAEEQLERAVARTEFFNDLMVHDLNNMHQGIMSGLELLLMDPGLSRSSTDFAERSLEQTRRSVALVGNVRKLSRVDKEQVKLSKKHPFPMLMSAIEMVKNSFPKKEISLNTNIVEGSHPVLAGDFLLDIFYNLLLNSMNADPSNEVILDILATPSDEAGFMKIVFKDRGPGINDEMKETILSRLEGRGPHGWGLGLTLVKRIIDRYGGKIWIEDRVEGDHKQGACIVMLLVDAS